MQKVERFGEKVRSLREQSEMPLRKLAALLDIDQSTLSKVERDERKPTIQVVEQIAKIFKTDKKGLVISFYSDIVADEIQEENSYSEILQVAEAKIEYQRIKTKKSK